VNTTIKGSWLNGGSELGRGVEDSLKLLEIPRRTAAGFAMPDCAICTHWQYIDKGKRGEMKKNSSLINYMQH
jgi:hypothetical protein